MNPSFAYVYDDRLSEARFERSLAEIEGELARLGMNGRTLKPGMFRSQKEMIEDAVRGGVKTVVFVGSDQTLLKTMWFLPFLPVTVGMIPCFEPMNLCQKLGIGKGTVAVGTLAARHIETYDIGRVGDRCFLTELTVSHTKAALDLDSQFKIQTTESGAIAVRNLGSVDGSVMTNAQDGKLEVVIQTLKEKEQKTWFAKQEITETHLFMRKGQLVSPEPFEFFLDGQGFQASGFSVEIWPRAWHVIVGRGRRTTSAP